MRLRIVISILIVFGALALLSCSPAERLAKFKEKHGELFRTEIDTVFIEEPVDSIGMIVETDSIEFVKKLDLYAQVVDSLERLTLRLDEASLQDRRTLFATKQRLMNELSKGSFKATEGPLIDPNGRFNLMVRFDPENKTFSLLKGSVFNERVITKKEYITVKEKPTTWELLKYSWWMILIIVVLIIALIKK
jgi:hypothetical protein